MHTCVNAMCMRVHIRVSTHRLFTYAHSLPVFLSLLSPSFPLSCPFSLSCKAFSSLHSVSSHSGSPPYTRRWAWSCKKMCVCILPPQFRSLDRVGTFE